MLGMVSQILLKTTGIILCTVLVWALEAQQLVRFLVESNGYILWSLPASMNLEK